MKKLIESFNNLNDQLRYCLLVGVVFLIILLDVVFLVLPQMASISDVNDQIKKVADDTQQVVVDKGQINRLKKNFQNAKDQFVAISSKIHTLQEVPVILSTTSSIANAYGVKIDQMVPEKTQQEILKTTPEFKFYSLPILIKAHGGYHMFGRFLNKLENENLSFIMKDFIVQNDGVDPKVHSYTLTIDLILVGPNS